MAKRVTGHYEESTYGGETVRAFVPAPLDPRLALAPEIDPVLRGVNEERLARLEIAGQMVPSHGWFVCAFARKEAVISSQIEGTQVTLAVSAARGSHMRATLSVRLPQLSSALG